MKRYLVILLLSLALTPVSPVFCKPSDSSPTAHGMPQLGNKEIEALNEWAKLLEGMSEEELEQLAAVGEEYMKELEQQGIDPMEFLFHEDSPIWEKPPVLNDEDEMEEPKKEPVTTPTITEPEIKEPEKKESTLLVTDKEKIKNIKHKLEDIADKITSLRQKAESKRSLSDRLQPFELALSDLVYFALTAKESHLVKFLFDKKFEPLYTFILELHKALDQYEPQIYVTEFSLEGEDPYMILDVSPSASFEAIYQRYQILMRDESPFAVEAQLKEQGKSPEFIKTKLEKVRKRWNKIIWAYEALQAKENSKYALETLLNIIQEMLYKNNLIAKFKELLKAYDPEALAIKEEQENKEKKAREEQAILARQRPAWTQPVFESAPLPKDYSDDLDKYLWDGGSSIPSYSPPSDKSSTSSPTDSTSTSDQKSSNGKKDKNKKDKDKKDKDKKDKDKKDKNKDKKKDKDKDKDEEKNDKKKDKDKDKKPQSKLDRMIFKFEDSLASIQSKLTENEELIVNLTDYLAKPYNEAEKEKAFYLNQLLASLTLDLSSLDETVKKDLEEVKENKERYIKSIDKKYTSFRDDEHIKKIINVLGNLHTQDNNIMLKENIIAANPIKKFMLTGIQVPEAQKDLITPDIQSINNPLMGQEIAPINYIQNFRQAYDNFSKLMRDTLPAPKLTPSSAVQQPIQAGQPVRPIVGSH